MESNKELLEQLRDRRRKLVRDKNWSAALEVVNTSLMIESTFERYYNKGVILLQLGQFEEAIFCFEKSTELSPQFNKGRQGIAKARIMQQNQILEQNHFNEEQQVTNFANNETVTIDNKMTSTQEPIPPIKEHTYSSKIPPLPSNKNYNQEATAIDINIEEIANVKMEKQEKSQSHSYFSNEIVDSDE